MKAFNNMNNNMKLQYTVGPFLELQTSKTYETSHLMKALEQYSALHKFQADVLHLDNPR